VRLNLGQKKNMTTKFIHNDPFYVENITKALQTLDEFGPKIKVVSADEVFYVSSILRIYSSMLNLLLDQSSFVFGVPVLMLPDVSSKSLKLLLILLKEGIVEIRSNQSHYINTILDVAKILQINVKSIEIKEHEQKPTSLSNFTNDVIDPIKEVRTVKKITLHDEEYPLSVCKIPKNNNNVKSKISIKVASFAKADPGIKNIFGIDKESKPDVMMISKNEVDFFNPRSDKESKDKKNEIHAEFKCFNCLKEFSKVDQMECHLNNTLIKAKRLFECPVNRCYRSYIEVDNLFSHCQEHRLNNEEILRQMIHKMKVGKVFKCPSSDCKSSFPRLRGLLSHGLKKHSMNSEEIMTEMVNIGVLKYHRCPISQCHHVFKNLDRMALGYHARTIHNMRALDLYKLLFGLIGLKNRLKC